MSSGYNSVLFVLGLVEGSDEGLFPSAPPGSQPSARVVIFDRYGTALAELDGNLSRVSWRLNNVGKAVFSVAKSDDKATADNLRFYNRVLVQFGNGLPDWGGVLVPPRDWDSSEIRLTMLDGAELLHYRMTASSRYFEQQAAGYIYKTLIREANTELDTGIDVGTVYEGGADRTPAPYHYDGILTKIQALAALSGFDFEIVPVLSGGTLRFQANWYERRGLDRPNVVLIEDHNVEVRKFSERGPIINHWAGIGEGATWTAKPTVEATDAASQSLYGYQQQGRAFTGVVNEDTLEANVDALLAETAYPRPLVSLDALDVAPASFASYDVGDRIRVILHNYGFSGSTTGYDHAVRVLAREYDMGSGKCSLVIQEDEFSGDTE